MHLHLPKILDYTHGPNSLLWLLPNTFDKAVGCLTNVADQLLLRRPQTLTAPTKPQLQPSFHWRSSSGYNQPPATSAATNLSPPTSEQPPLTTPPATSPTGHHLHSCSTILPHRKSP
ncbi:hypothetical protein M758_UG072800 [Ceratodon purpureus]|nr:hypothetical protein M758_UG072800 [Ceratodon purpureus]